jgi:hypothetical protein
MNTKKIKLFFSKNNNFLPILKKYFKVLSRFNRNIFIIFLIVYFAFLLIERLWGDNLREYIYLNNALIFLIICGIIFSLSIEKDKVTSKKYVLKSKDVVLIIISGLIGSYLIWDKIKQWQIISYFIAIPLGIFITCFLYLYLKDE